jgi:lipopolysaccharide transport system ATP-binding protein
MSDIAIRVENLAKMYRIGAKEEQPRSVGQKLRNLASSPFAYLSQMRRPPTEDETLWALRDVSFEVKQGEVIGVIGTNGAGKSTLLKILARITEPTQGRAEIRGRIGSLLEVGTGFHPELTGRENVYLNGTILGMRHWEIDRKFDEIVAFAEIEKFLDTPVKRYSSGMYVRLAFAVAAHLEPEILLVDEVLAVGDAAFQKKCLGKMDEVAGMGRTILFVSHNTSAIQRLCGRSLLLERGKSLMCGHTTEVLVRYLSDHSSASIPPAQWIDVTDVERQRSHMAGFTALRYSSCVEAVSGHAYTDGPLDICLRIKSDAAREVGSMAVTFYDENGTKLINCDTVTLGSSVQLLPGLNEYTCRIAQLHLNPGVYTIGLWLANISHFVLDRADNIGRLEVLDAPSTVGNVRPEYDGVVTCSFQVLPGVVAGTP